MQRQQAKKNLQLIAFQCYYCNQQYPAYRITLLNQNQSQAPSLSKRKQQKQQQSEEIIGQSNKSRNPIRSPKDRSISPCPLRSIKSDNLHVTSKNKATKYRDHVFACLGCLNEEKINKIYKQTFDEAANKLIQKIPIPQYFYAEKCLQKANQIQEKYDKIIKSIIKQLQQMKFAIFRLCSQTKRLCQDYIDKVKYFQHFNIEEWRHISEENKVKSRSFTNITLNQNQILNKISGKYKLLQKVSIKIDQVKASIPNLSDYIKQESQINKQKQSICNVPISAITNVKGKIFYGIADGRIIYETISGFMTNHQHQSLLRSFAYDGQFTLYSGSDDFTIKAWDLHSDQIKCIRTFAKLQDSKSYHRNISIIRNGSALVSTRGQFDNFKIRIWELKNEYQNIGQMSGHKSFIRDMISLSNDKIITVSQDKTIKLWNTKLNKVEISSQNLFKISAVTVSQKLGLCAIADQQNKIKILDLQNSLENVTSWKLQFRINILKSISSKYQYIVIAMIPSISFWDWQGSKLFNIDMQANFVASCLTIVEDTIIMADGTGFVIKHVVPLLKQNTQKIGN